MSVVRCSITHNLRLPSGDLCEKNHFRCLAPTTKGKTKHKNVKNGTEPSKKKETLCSQLVRNNSFQSLDETVPRLHVFQLTTELYTISNLLHSSACKIKHLHLFQLDAHFPSSFFKMKLKVPNVYIYCKQKVLCSLSNTKEFVFR